VKLGYQTIVFGPRIDDLESVLDTIAQAGFQGVEFAQRPEMIRIRQDSTSVPVRVTMLREMMEARGLTFLGIAGGSLQERIDFCEGAGEPEPILPYRPLYLYMEECSAEIHRYAAERGYNLALHPHVYMRLQRLATAKHHLEEARKRQSNPNWAAQGGGQLYWMPDTAHLHIVGDDPENALSLVPQEQMVAVHLKDWDSAFGRSYHRYARGFCPLGSGNVPVARVITALRRMNYTGWVVVEKDHSRTLPHETVFRAANWLASQGVMPTPRPGYADLIEERSAQALLPVFTSKHSPESRAAFSWALMQASSLNLSECYRVMAGALQEYYKSCHVSLWACGPAREDMSLMAASPEELPEEGEHVLERSREIFDDNIERRAAMEISLEDFAASGSSWVRTAEAVGAKTVVSIPVLNRYNHHHIRFLVVLMQPEPGMFDYVQEAVALGETLARVADAALDDACSYAAGKVNFIANTTQTLRDFLRAMRDVAHTMVEAEGVTIFLVNRTRERLIEMTTTGIEWDAELPDNEHFYDPSHSYSITVRAWQEAMPILKPDMQSPVWSGQGYKPRSREKGAEVTRERDNILLVPLISTIIDSDLNEVPTVIGMVRCRNKRMLKAQPGAPSPKVRIFTEDDAALVDALCQAAVPHIELLRAEAIRAEAVGRLTHELAMPVNALRGAVDSLRMDLEDADSRLRDLFRFDYIGDVLSWTDLMVRIIGNGVIYGLKDGNFPLKPRRTLLMAEVVAPAVRQVRFLLEEREFDSRRISYTNFEEIPRLWVDQNQFQQVIFNLLSNAIKYSYDDPKQFRVEIVSGAEEDYYRVSCRDWGPGIVEGYERSIFEETVRGPRGLNRMVEGMGLGLWVVKRIVEAHGGYVAVTNLYRPTEVTVYLPTSLASSPPRQQKQNRQ
jgi:signal transduction histidine kinase/sugar phosphate isomerase/epimerase